MKLSEVLHANMVWPDLNARTKQDVLREISRRISENAKNMDESLINEVLWDREKLGSSGIEDGIAIPHAKVPKLENILLAFARSVDGVDFDAHDSKPTHFFFVLLAPAGATGMHLKVLAKISRLLKESKFRARLMEAQDSDEIYNIIIDEDKNL